MLNRDFTFIHKYFLAEKQESLLFLIVGIVAVIIAVVFFFFMQSNPSFFKGAAIPLVAIGLLQTIVGYTVFARSDKQRVEVAYKMGMDNSGFVQMEELPRMQAVNKNFVLYRYIEIALFLTGLVFIFLFKGKVDKAFWLGLGVTLTIQSLIMLGADYFAERRALEYTRQITSLTHSVN